MLKESVSKWENSRTGPEFQPNVYMNTTYLAQPKRFSGFKGLMLHVTTMEVCNYVHVTLSHHELRSKEPIGSQ